MSILVNLRHLEKKSLQLTGETESEALELGIEDEVLQPRKVFYDLEVQKLERNLLIQGNLRVSLHCECVRCLKPFETEFELADWVCHIPLEGEERAAVANDCVDLTPYVREDILLGLPQHPLCQEGCRGLIERPAGKSSRPEKTGRAEVPSPAWSALNKLKFEK